VLRLKKVLFVLFSGKKNVLFSGKKNELL